MAHANIGSESSFYDLAMADTKTASSIFQSMVSTTEHAPCEHLKGAAPAIWELELEFLCLVE